MSDAYTLSDMGLRLIKAYEGFYATPRTLTSGDEIIGYGHHMVDDTARTLTEKQAEKLLQEDLAPIEDMVNNTVHTSLTQSQYDALVSLAFSIGSDAFKNSDILHALNRGEFIEAANGFDSWRLAKVEGKIYVVDALVRRRTAEKALFLRPTHRIVRASRHQIQAQLDSEKVETYPVEQLALSSDAQELTPVIEANEVDLVAENSVAFDTSEVDAEESVSESETEVITESIVSEEDEVILAETDGTLELENNERQIDEEISPIAEAAAEVSDRLDALMLQADQDEQSEFEVTPPNVLDFKQPILIDDTAPTINSIDEPTDYASEYYNYDADVANENSGEQKWWAYAFIGCSGLLLSFMGVLLSLKGTENLFGSYGPFIAFVLIFVGALMTIGGFYYLIKTVFGWGKDYDLPFDDAQYA